MLVAAFAADHTRVATGAITARAVEMANDKISLPDVIFGVSESLSIEQATVASVGP